MGIIMSTTKGFEVDSALTLSLWNLPNTDFLCVFWRHERYLRR